MRENGKYRVLHGCYWMLINVVFGYTVFYLSRYGYSAGEIGVLSAVFSAISAICQPVLGRVADKSRKFGWKTQIRLFSLIGCTGFLILSVISNQILVGLLFGILMLSANYIQPMLNAACFYYMKQGISIDFGIARGIGSMAYAVMSFSLGYLTVRFGTAAVLAAGVLMTLMLFVVVSKMPYDSCGEFEKKADEREFIPEESVRYRDAECSDLKENKEASASKKGFLKKYPAFSLMVFGCVLLLAVHHFMTTYLLNIMEFVGGDSGNMGTALAIGALTEIPILFLFSKIVKRIPAASLLVISGISYIGKTLVFFMAGNVWMVYAAHLLQPVSYGLYASATIYFANECMQEEDKVTGQSFMTMAMAAGSLVGNLLGGWLIDYSGVKMMLGFAVCLAVVAAGVVTAACVLYKKSLCAEKHLDTEV